MAKTPAAAKKPAAKKPAAKKPAASKAAPKASAAAPATGAAKVKFAKAIEEARAGAQALASQAQEKADAYRAKATTQGEAWLDDAKEYGT